MKKRSFIKICGKDIKVEGRLIRIARLDGEKFTFPDDPEAVLNGLRKCGTRIDLFTFLQKLPETSPKYAYPMEWDNLAVLPVSTFENWWTHQIRSFPRNRARQAEKRGVVLREVPFDDNLLQGICEIYNECPIRQGRRFPHYGMSVGTAREYAGTFLDRSIFIGAFLNDSMIGFIKLVFDETRTYACAIHILSMLQHRDKAPTNALVAQAVRSCADRRIAYLVYENFSYGKKQGDSLSQFKEVNGFQRIDMPRYYVPLTLVGRAALRLGLHHRFIDYFPEPVMTRLRKLRTAWYTHKLQMLRDVS
jgi:hypothetical protein